MDTLESSFDDNCTTISYVSKQFEGDADEADNDEDKDDDDKDDDEEVEEETFCCF